MAQLENKYNTIGHVIIAKQQDIQYIYLRSIHEYTNDNCNSFVDSVTKYDLVFGSKDVHKGKLITHNGATR